MIRVTYLPDIYGYLRDINVPSGRRQTVQLCIVGWWLLMLNLVVDMYASPNTGISVILYYSDFSGSTCTLRKVWKKNFFFFQTHGADPKWVLYVSLIR